MQDNYAVSNTLGRAQTIGGSGVSPNAPKGLEIHDALESTGRRIDLNRALIEQLCTRLELVRVPCPRPDSPEKSRGQEYGCSLGQVIATHNNSLERSNMILQALLEEIQV